MANYLRCSRVYKNRRQTTRQSTRHSIKQHFFKEGGNPPKVTIKSRHNQSAPTSSFAMVSETLDKKKDGSELGNPVHIDSNGNKGEAMVDSEEDWIDDETPLVYRYAKPVVKHHIQPASKRAPKAALAAFWDAQENRFYRRVSTSAASRPAAKAALTAYNAAEERLAEQMGLSVAEMRIKASKAEEMRFMAAEERIEEERIARHAAEVKRHREEMLNRKPLTVEDMRGYNSEYFVLNRD
jgi:hypothetical protein